MPISTSCQPIPSIYKCPEILTAQNNHTRISCTNKTLPGSVCTWKCDNYFKLNKRGKNIRCKCKLNKNTLDLNDFSCKWSNQEASQDSTRFCMPKGGYFKSLRKQIKESGSQSEIDVLNEKMENAKQWL